jgi:hypothetical protein
LTSCAHDSPFRTVVLSIQIIVPATEKVITGHDPLTATMAPPTSASRLPALADTMVFVAAAGDLDGIGEIAWTSRPWQEQTVTAATVNHSRAFTESPTRGRHTSMSNARAIG